MEKRRINISSKRQITIPSKYYEALDLAHVVTSWDNLRWRMHSG